MKMFEAKTDAINEVIIPALGDDAADFDHDAIFDAIFEWVAVTNDKGEEIARETGFVQTADDVEFWAAVEAAAL